LTLKKTEKYATAGPTREPLISTTGLSAQTGTTFTSNEAVKFHSVLI